MQRNPYTRILLLALETTGDAPRQLDPRETIEIGAVLVDGNTLEFVDEHQSHVRPLVHPQLSDFCAGLTGIPQSAVDSAPLFKEALKRFEHWLHHESTGAEFPIAWWGSWGWHVKRQLEGECTRTGTPLPLLQTPHVNLKEEFAQMRNVKVQGLAKAGDRLGLDFQGLPHRALDHARMVAKVLKRMRMPSKELSRSDTAGLP